jgi:hypothetical protein
VARRKASARAADSANTGRAFEHAAEPLEGKAIQDHSALQSGYDGRARVGHLLLRGNQGVEAFDADDHSFGMFPDAKTAAAAISARGRS